MGSDHEDRVEALREQLRQARRELKEEKRANVAADAALREQEAQESRKSHDEILSQLKNIAGTLRTQRDIQEKCWNVAEKVDDEHRIKKDSGIATLRGMMIEVREAQTTGKEYHEGQSERAVKAGRFRASLRPHLYGRGLTGTVDVDAVLEEARKNSAEQKAAFASLSDGKFEWWTYYSTHI